jgi:hypothetical protein
MHLHSILILIVPSGVRKVHGGRSILSSNAVAPAGAGKLQTITILYRLHALTLISTYGMIVE